MAHAGHTGTAGSANAGMFDREMEEEACQAGNSVYGDDTVRCLLKNWQVDPLPVRCQEGTWGGRQLGGNVGTAGSFKSTVSASHRSMHAPCPGPNPLASATTCCFSVQVATPWKGSRTLGHLWLMLVSTRAPEHATRLSLGAAHFPAGRPLWLPCHPKCITLTVPQTVPWGVGNAWGS